MSDCDKTILKHKALYEGDDDALAELQKQEATPKKDWISAITDNDFVFVATILILFGLFLYLVI